MTLIAWVVTGTIALWIVFRDSSREQHGVDLIRDAYDVVSLNRGDVAQREWTCYVKDKPVAVGVSVRDNDMLHYGAVSDDGSDAVVSYQSVRGKQEANRNMTLY
jgi:hypothetical protein